MRCRAKFAAELEALLIHHWWQISPTWLARLLQPLAWLYGWLSRWLSRRHCARARKSPRAPAPVLIVGNQIVGGAGKTPTIIALVQAFRAAGRHPAVLARGHGGAFKGIHTVLSNDDPRVCGDEPLLIRRRTGVPVWVGRDRAAIARALCARHPEVDVLLSDDGLQHRSLARDAELLVFDARGVGNGLLLPAGPLREKLPRRLQAHQRALYTDGCSTTPLHGAMARRQIAHAWPLAAWQRQEARDALALDALRGRPLLAVAGLAAPEKFFAMLEAAGLNIRRLPLPDHHAYDSVPWSHDTQEALEVVTTEKDAVKLVALPLRSARVWVVPLDLVLPDGLAAELLALLPLQTTTPPP